MQQDQNKRSKLVGIRRAERVFIGLGCLLLVVYAAAQAHAEVGRWQAIGAFRLAQAQTREADRADPTATVDTSNWAAGRVQAYEESLTVSMRAPEALLLIPSIDLTVPIFEGTAELNLSRGVGRIEGTAALNAPGNLGIAGHRDGFFRGLKDVEIGDVIEVQSVDQNATYRIADIKIVEPSDVSVLDYTSEQTLTLVTCYPFYFVGHAPQRYIIQAVRLESGSELST